jgi:hypothetical protein
MKEARYDVMSLISGDIHAVDVPAIEATRIINDLQGAARCRFHSDDFEWMQRVPWPLPLVVAD